VSTLPIVGAARPQPLDFLDKCITIRLRYWFNRWGVNRIGLLCRIQE
jgi:hypothetical protein